MSAESLEQKIQEIIRDGKLIPRAIVPVDLFGLPADYSKIQRIAEKYHLYILEDAAQGFGGKIGDQRACSFGDISTTSFFPAKPLGCYGDGGAVFTDDDKTAELIRSFCVHGKGAIKYDNIRIGVNSRLDTIQAAILLPKLEAFCRYELEDINRSAELYTSLLSHMVKTPIVPEGFFSSWAQYTIQLHSPEERSVIQEELHKEGIPSMVYYIKPMHKQRAFAGLDVTDEDYANTIQLCDTVLSLPMHPYLSEEEIQKVAGVILQCLNK